MPRYFTCGLRVESSVALPGICTGPALGGQPDVFIQRGAVANVLHEPTAAAGAWAMRGEDILLRFDGIVRILVHDGMTITFETESGVPEREALPFVTGTAFGMLLQQRGQLVLHASAVRAPAGAALFCGPSGAGKSTLAAALTERGFDLVADDVAAVLIDREGCPAVHRDQRDLKLWIDAADALVPRDRLGAALPRRAEKFYVTPSARAVGGALPIAAVYFLNRSTGESCARRLERLEGASALRAAAYRPMLVRAMNQEERYFSLSMHILRRVPAYELRVARGWDRLPSVIERLEETWNTRLREDGSSTTAVP